MKNKKVKHRIQIWFLVLCAVWLFGEASNPASASTVFATAPQILEESASEAEESADTVKVSAALVKESADTVKVSAALVKESANEAEESADTVKESIKEAKTTDELTQVPADPTTSPTGTIQASEVAAEIIFDANGGSFQSNGGSTTATIELTKADIEQLGTQRRFPVSKFPVPVKKGYKLVRWYNETKDKNISKTNGYIALPAVTDTSSIYKVVCVAQWKMETYSIQYHWNGGSLQNNEKVVKKYNITSQNIQLPTPQKKGFCFGGWYTNANFNGKAIKSIPNGSTGNLNLYAKWISASPAKVEIESTSGKNKKLVVKIKKAANAKGYEIAISQKKSFPKKSTIHYQMGTGRKFSITQLAKGTYYVKVRAYAYDDARNECYGSYSKVAAVKITSSTKEYKATSTSAKIISAKVQSAEEVKIKATIKKQVKSSDNYYYLVKVNPSKNTAETVLGKAFKAKKVTFTLDTEDKVNVMSKFAVAIKQDGKLKLISKAAYVTNPEKAATNKMEYVKPASKKGIHGASDANLGAKNTMCNVNLNDLITTKGKGTAYVYNGKTYYFTNVQQGYVKECNAQNISVTMMIYLTWNDKNTYLIHPSARNKGKYYYALNTVDEKARETLEAAFAYLGESFGKKDCYVSNWVLGNEVNSQEMWNHAGNLSLAEYSKSYAQAFQMLSYGVKSSYSNARIFIPLDNAWNISVSKMGWNGKTFLKAFDQALEKESPKTKWNLAYHAYSYPLTATAYGKNQHVTNSENSPYIGMKNIEVLTSYIKKHYGSKTRIILSEQGYTATLGEKEQAASILYGYYKAEFNSMIDAYIIRSQYDHAGEIASDGLAMGLSDGNHRKRQAYTIFKYMDTPKSAQYAKKYLKTIGAKSWKSVIPGYNAKKFKKMEQ